MRYFTVLCLIVLFLPSWLQAEETKPSLTQAEIAAVERICVQMVGADHVHWYRLWDKLRPFVRSTAEFDNHDRVIVCSAGCQGSVALRGGYGVSASGQKESEGSAAYRMKTNVVTYVTFSRGDHDILSLAINTDDASRVYVSTRRKELLAHLPVPDLTTRSSRPPGR